MSDTYNLRYMLPSDLDNVLDWRNSSKIRKSMFSQKFITKKEHYAWFKSSSNNSNKILLIFQKNSVPKGYMNFNMQDTKVAYWGFYTSPSAEKGIGTVMGKMALKYAFTTLELEKVIGEVIISNKASIRFHTKIGFTRKKTSIDSSGKEDIIHFELKKNQWNDS